MLEAASVQVSLISCHRVKLEAVRLRQQLDELRQLTHIRTRSDLMAAYKPAFDIMRADILALRRSLQAVHEEVGQSAPMLEESRRFARTVQMILDDTATLIELLLWLSDEGAQKPRSSAW